MLCEVCRWALRRWEMYWRLPRGQMDVLVLGSAPLYW